MPNESFDSHLHAAAFDACGAAMLILDGDCILDCNKSALNLLKYPSRAALCGVAVDDISAPERQGGSSSDALLAQRIVRANATNLHEFDWVCRDLEGRSFNCEISLHAFPWKNRQMLSLSLREKSTRLAGCRDQTELHRAFFQYIFNDSELAIVLVEEDSSITDANPAFEKLFRMPREEALGRNPLTLVPESRRHESDALTKQGQSDLPGSIKDTIRLRFDSSTVAVSVLTVPVTLEDGSKLSCVVYRDTTDQWQAHETARESEERLRMVISNLPVILYAMDTKGVFTMTEGKGLESLGFTAGASVGESIFDAFPDLEGFHDRFRAALRGDTPTTIYESAGVVFETRYAPMRNSQGQVTGVIAMALDVTETREIRHRLEHMAHHDLVTGLANRMLLESRIADAVARARTANQLFALMFVDIDSFKAINDSLGHIAGDRVLRIIGSRIANTLPESATVARLGGDEFAIVIENMTHPLDASHTAQMLLDALAEPLFGEGIPISTSASIGISVFPNDGENMESLLANADRAMYEAKRSRNSYRFFSRDMSGDALETLMLSGSMRDALGCNEFVLHYQPIVNLADDTVTGFEALIRWNHPVRGLLGPQHFIPIAEGNGFIEPLGEWVITEACRQLREWMQNGHANLRVSVNLSARQLNSPRFADKVESLLAESGIPADTLLLEITESMMLPHPDLARSILNRFHAMGVPVAIDDFGTGYASLAYLHELPLDYLKIDRSFVSRVPADDSACTIIQTIIAMAKGLGLKVIAEGVETAAQLELLRASGCQAAQGFYFSKPVPIEEATALVCKCTSGSPAVVARISRAN